MIPNSPKTPVKISSRDKDSICLLCGTCLFSVNATFNLISCQRLQEQLEELIERPLNLTKQSSRLCRSCGRKIETLSKKSSVLRVELEKLRKKINLPLRGVISQHAKPLQERSEISYVKRCAKNTPEREKNDVDLNYLLVRPTKNQTILMLMHYWQMNAVTIFFITIPVSILMRQTKERRTSMYMYVANIFSLCKY